MSTTSTQPSRTRPPRQRSAATRPSNSQGRSRDLLASGISPVTLLPLLDATRQRRCGQCAHRFPRQLDDGSTRDKCAHAAAKSRSGPDVPADYPACTDFRAAEATTA